MKNFWLILSCAFVFGLGSTTVASATLVSFGAPSPINSNADTDNPDDTADSDNSPATAAGDSGTWISVWSSNNSSGGIGSDSDILFSRSTDSGASWSAPAALDPGAGLDGGFADSQPDVAYGSGGVWIAVWTSTNDLGGPIGSDNDILASVSVDDGVTWSAPTFVNSDASSDSAATSGDILPTVVAGSGSEWVVAWNKNEGTSGSQFFASSTNNGSSWSTRTALGIGGNSDGQGISVGYNGSKYVAAWSSTNTLGGTIGADTDILSTSITAGSFTVGSLVVVNSGAAGDGATDSDRFPDLAISGSNVVVAWQRRLGISGDLDVFSSSSADGGATWSPMTAVNSNEAGDLGDDERVSLAYDGDMLVAVWSSNDEVGKTIKTDDDILVATSSDDGGSWSAVTHLASTAVKDKGGDENPDVATDGAGTWLVAYESKDSFTKTIGTDSDILGIRASEDCPSVPFGGCFEPGLPKKGFLLMKEKAKKDLFKWKFAKGPEVTIGDLGSPTTTDDYLLCAWDQVADSDELVVELDIPAGGSCFANDCWEATTPVFLYKHKFGVVGVMTLTSGEDGKSKAQVKSGFGFKAPPLGLAADSTVTVQLRNQTNGECWSTEFSTLSPNGPDLVKGKSD